MIEQYLFICGVVGKACGVVFLGYCGMNLTEAICTKLFTWALKPSKTEVK